MTVRKSAERLPLIPPHLLPHSFRFSSASSHLSDYDAGVRTDDADDARRILAATADKNLPSNDVGNVLRRPLSSGDIDGESSGIHRFRFLRATDNPC